MFSYFECSSRQVSLVSSEEELLLLLLLWLR